MKMYFLNSQWNSSDEKFNGFFLRWIIWWKLFRGTIVDDYFTEVKTVKYDSDVRMTFGKKKYRDYRGSQFFRIKFLGFLCSFFSHRAKVSQIENVKSAGCQNARYSASHYHQTNDPSWSYGAQIPATIVTRNNNSIDPASNLFCVFSKILIPRFSNFDGKLFKLLTHIRILGHCDRTTSDQDNFEEIIWPAASLWNRRIWLQFLVS